MTSTDTQTAAAPQDQRLSDSLRQLEHAAGGQPISIEQMVKTLADRGNAMMIFILSAPFVVIPIPGLSTVVGVVVTGLSLGVLLGGSPWLPGFVRRKQVTPDRLKRLVSGTEKTLGKVKRFVKPRMAWAVHPAMHWLIGLSLLAATFAFALPLPIPGNNIPPAIALVLLSLGLLERDGLLVLVGHVYTLIMWLIIIACVIIFWQAFGEWIGHVLAKLQGYWTRVFG
jgi:hypothetical protein